MGVPLFIIHFRFGFSRSQKPSSGLPGLPDDVPAVPRKAQLGSVGPEPGTVDKKKVMFQ